MSWSVSVRGNLGRAELEIAFETTARVVLLVGPNGSGKSTVVRTIAGADNGLEARVEVGGRLLDDTSAGVGVPSHRRGIGYLPQGQALFPHMNVLRNVAFGCPPGEAGAAAARAALEELGVAHLAERRPGSLSGGERQSVALARALAPDPPILMLDEPLSALDAASRRRTRAYLSERLTASDRPALIVTHDLRDVRAFDAVVVVIEHGRVVQTGTAAAIAAAPATAFTTEFFDTAFLETGSDDAGPAGTGVTADEPEHA